MIERLLGLLRAVTAAGLLAVAHRCAVESRTDDLVADTREVLHAAAANEHDRMLLQVVADARDVGSDLHLIGQTDASNLAKGRVRLLRGGRVHARAHAALLRVAFQRRRLALARRLLAALADQLVNRRQSTSPSRFLCPPCGGTPLRAHASARPSSVARWHSSKVRGACQEGNASGRIHPVPLRRSPARKWGGLPAIRSARPAHLSG